MKHDEVTTKLLVNDGAGIHIPSIFANTFVNLCDDKGNDLEGEILMDMNLIKNPDNLLYWEAWENVLNTVHIKDGDDIYSLHQNGDLWAFKKDDLEALNETEHELFWENYLA